MRPSDMLHKKTKNIATDQSVHKILQLLVSRNFWIPDVGHWWTIIHFKIVSLRHQLRKYIAKIIKICYWLWQIDYNYEETLNFVYYPDWLNLYFLHSNKHNL